MTTNLPQLLDRGEAARAEWLRWVRYRNDLLDAVVAQQEKGDDKCHT